MMESKSLIKKHSDASVVVIQPSVRWTSINLRELWGYRDLIYFLTWRDIKVRYKQATLGVAWTVIQPLITMVIFSLIFGKLAKLPSDGIPYPIFIYAGLLPWQLFSGSLTRVSTSLVTNANLLTKVYFPRLVIPLSAIAAGLVDFGISFLVLSGLMLYYGILPNGAVLLLPFLVLFAVLTALGVGLWLSALNVQYRDVQYMVPFVVQVWMFVSPVVYSDGLIPKGLWSVIYGLNPMAGVIQGFRYVLLNGNPPDELMIVAIIMVLMLLGSGLFYFKRMEKYFADVV